MMFFYDGQIRRYLKQMIRLMSHFSIKDGDGDLKRVPVAYGDMSRLAAFAMKDGSENIIGSVPKIAVYITSLEIDRQRTSDSTFVSKVHIRERAFDENNQEYLNKEGRNYTVERLMPTPYQLGLNADIWTTNTDEKLQILEQILMLFNPSLEIQTTDNFIDWTSLTVVDLEQVNFSSRSVGSGSTETEIDIATLSFKTPIFISPPAKVKRLGVIHTIVTSIFNEHHTAIQNDDAMVDHLEYSTDHPFKSDAVVSPKITADGDMSYDFSIPKGSRSENNQVAWSTTYQNYNLMVLNNEIQLLPKDPKVAADAWKNWFLAHAKPDCYQEGITGLRLYRNDYATEIYGLLYTHPDANKLIVEWDADTLPSDTILTGPFGDNTKINYIINPLKTNPEQIKSPGGRLLLLDSGIGAAHNQDGADAWKNDDFTDFVAGENDIIEWDGNKWHVVFSAAEYEGTEPIFTTNLHTGIQYKYENGDWLLSYEGEYPHGTWQIDF